MGGGGGGGVGGERGEDRGWCLGFYIGGTLGFDDARADQGSEPALRFTFYLPRSAFFY